MARLPKDSPFGALEGALGKEIVFKQYAYKVVVTKYPDMSRVNPPTLQIMQRNLLKQANEYVQCVLPDPALKAAMKKDLLPGETVYHKAKKAFFAEKR
ncbi:hypothetical protein HRH25_18705 [Flavisolibacter sp. BT320]|nr:hypothetical protein [Flavisolibacter longurius]